MGMATQKYKCSSSPIPKDLPPLLRARAVALGGKSVGVNIGRKCWHYKTVVDNGEKGGRGSGWVEVITV